MEQASEQASKQASKPTNGLFWFILYDYSTSITMRGAKHIQFATPKR